MAKRALEQELYRRIPITELIVFSIDSVLEQGGKCVFERLVKECFTLFPKSFSFAKFPKWPDSRKLDSSLRHLRKRKLIVGDPKTFYSLTKLGKKIAEETAKTFRQRKLKL